MAGSLFGGGALFGLALLADSRTKCHTTVRSRGLSESSPSCPTVRGFGESARKKVHVRCTACRKLSAGRIEHQTAIRSKCADYSRKDEDYRGRNPLSRSVHRNTRRRRGRADRDRNRAPRQ